MQAENRGKKIFRRYVLFGVLALALSFGAIPHAKVSQPTRIADYGFYVLEVPAQAI